MFIVVGEFSLVILYVFKFGETPTNGTFLGC